MILLLLLLGRNIKIPNKRTHTHEKSASCGISLWSYSGSTPVSSHRPICSRRTCSMCCWTLSANRDGWTCCQNLNPFLLSLVLLWSVWNFAGQKGLFNLFFLKNSISCFSGNANFCCLKCNRWLHRDSCCSGPRDTVCLWGESHPLAPFPAAVLHPDLQAWSL